MKSQFKFHIPFGKTELEFQVPQTMHTKQVKSKIVAPLPDPGQAVVEALQHPIGSPPLREMVNPGNRVCIVFTDITRSSPDDLLVPALLEELRTAGVRNADVTLLCGVGMHRPSTREEKVIKLGEWIVENYRVIDNEPQNPKVLVNLGTTAGGVPVIVHRAAVDADLLIATGLVEPHQYAGYSGGRKTLAIGAAGEALIAHTHGPSFVDHPGTRLGRIEGNPFHEVVAEAARRANLRFILNVVLDDHKRILQVGAGAPEPAFKELVAFARSVYEVSISQQYDVAIGGVGFPKDTNLYQASRAASYLYFATVPVVRSGGFLIIPALCQEGAGSGVGEQRFLNAMRDAPNIQFILDDARRNGYPPGQQRAFVMAKVLEQARVIIVGSQYPELVKECKMMAAPTIEEGLGIAQRELGLNLDVLIVPHALLTLPIIS